MKLTEVLRLLLGVEKERPVLGAAACSNMAARARAAPSSAMMDGRRGASGGRK
jgi:hypothetical protein